MYTLTFLNFLKAANLSKSNIFHDMQKLELIKQCL